MTGPPEEALVRGAWALRRLGARLTRLDAAEGTLEARTRRRWPLAAVIRLRATEAGPGVSRLTIESETPGAPRGLDFGLNARLIRRVRVILERTELPPLDRRG